MADLFYFLSTLPTLKSDGALPFSTEAFLSQCDELLGTVTCGRLRGISAAPDNTSSDDDVIAAWYGFETYLRNTTAEIRHSKMKLTAPLALRKNGAELYYIRKKIEEIMSISSPAEREYALDSMRFAFLDEQVSLHHFDMAVLEVYYIKLMILEKRASRRLQEGRSAFDSLLKTGLAQAETARNCDKN